MVWGAKKHRRGRSVPVLIARGLATYLACCSGRLAAFLLSALIYALTGVAPAHAVSSGCLAVRAGALNLTDLGGVAPVGVDLVPTFNGNFEAGETVTWTFGGNPAVQEVQINGGGPLPVAGGVATFTFPTTGAFAIDESIAENAGITATLTATCAETTGEKQAAVKNAVKTLTEMQLTRSLIFQQQLLQELTGTFLTGALPAILLETLESRLAALQERNSELDQLIYQASNRLGAVNNERSRIASEISAHKAVLQEQTRNINHETPQIESWAARLDLVMSQFVRWNDRYNQVLAERNRILHDKSYSQSREGLDERRRKLKPLDAELHQIALKKERMTPHVVDLNRLIDAARSRVAQFRSALAASQGKLASLEPQAARLDEAHASTAATLEKFRLEKASVGAQINRLQDQIASLSARVGQPPPVQLAGSNLQGALGLTASQANPFMGNPLGLKGTGGGLSFFTDLNTLIRQAHHEARLQQAPGATGPQVLTETGTANILNPAYNIWAKGNFSDFESDQAGADRAGQAHSFATGAYVAPSPRFMVGAMYRYRESESESAAQNSDVETTGHGAGVHSTIVFTPKLSASAQLLYERSDNDMTRGGATGSFDADQIVASGTLQGSLWRGPFWLRPSVGVTYAHVDSEAYTDSAGTRIPGQTTEQGQVTFGPSIGFRRWRETGAVKFIEPNFTATGVWTFKDEGDTTLASGTIIEQDEVAAQFSAGLSILLCNNMQLNFNAGYAGLGESEVESWSFGGQISIPLGAD